ncbi:MAG: hypothetical protein K2Q03_08785 [Sphingobacteriaceae bacterium]|nr:hypothetical protein [Sphingobacteriaceae bacterium]
MINQDNVFKKIGFILNELQDQYDYLAQQKVNITTVEVDFFMANVSFLNENAQVLKKIFQPIEVEDTQMPLAQKLSENIEEFETKIKEEEPEFVFELETKGLNFILENEEMPEQFDFELKPINELFDRPLSEDEALFLQKIEQKKENSNLLEQEENFEEEDFEEDEQAPEPFLLVRPSLENEIVIEEEIEKVKTLNDLLQNQTDSVNERRVEQFDLKSVINLNEKMLYVKELFGGYNLAYAEAIELVSKMPNYEAADLFLQKNYAVKNNWHEKSETSKQFYTLIEHFFKAR